MLLSLLLFLLKMEGADCGCKDRYLRTRLFICLILAPEELQKAVNISHGVSSYCDKMTVLNYPPRTFALQRETVVSLDVKQLNEKLI